MIIALHPNARTTPTVRAEITASSDSVAVLAALLLAGMLADRAGWWQAPSFDPFQPCFAWVSSLVCNAGWGGYSQGLWGIAGGIVLFGFLPAWLMWAWVVRQAYQLIRRRANLPPSGKPWFPLVLLAGRAAVWRGWCLLLAAGLALCLLLWTTYSFYTQLPQLLLPPSALKVC